MKNQICSVLFAVLISAKPALACKPQPDTVYDDVQSEKVLIATATVTGLDLDTSEKASCWSASYSAAKFLKGTGPDAFVVTTCAAFSQVADFSKYAEGFEQLGFVPGTEVLVGLVHPNDDPTDLRHAVPSCWGPLHVNLDQLSATKRAEFLEGLKAQIKAGK